MFIFAYFQSKTGKRDQNQKDEGEMGRTGPKSHFKLSKRVGPH